MMKHSACHAGLLIGAFSIVLLAGLGEAMANRLKGRYAATLTSRCQTTLVVRRDSNDNVTGINNSSAAGDMRGEVGTMIFSTSDGGKTGLVAMNIRAFFGSEILIKDKNQTNGSVLSLEKYNVGNIPYSVTPNSAKIDGKVLLATYGSFDNNGIARSAYLIRSSKGCITQITLQQ